MREEAGGGQKKEVRGSEWNCGGESGHTGAVAIVGVGIRTDGSRAHVVWWCGGVRRLVVVVMARYFAPRQCRSRAHRIAYQGSRVCAGAARALQASADLFCVEVSSVPSPVAWVRVAACWRARATLARNQNH